MNKEQSEKFEKSETLENVNRLSSLTDEMSKMYKELKEEGSTEVKQKFKNILLEAEGFMSAIEALGKHGELKEKIKELGQWFNNLVKEFESKSETTQKIEQDFHAFKEKVENLVKDLNR